MKNLTNGNIWNTGRFFCHCWSILGCLLITVFAAGCALTLPKVDCVSPIKGSLAELQASQPGLAWNSVIYATEVDLLQPVTDDKVLVGTFGKPEDLLASYVDFMLLNSRTGKKIWTYPRSSMAGLTQTVLAVDPVILVEGKHQNKKKAQVPTEWVKLSYKTY